MKYKLLDDLTSDVMIEAYGSVKEELFANAAEGMCSVICILEDVSEERNVEFDVSGEDLKDLLYQFLSQIIAQIDIEECFFKRFEVSFVEEMKIHVKAFGETLSPEKGQTVVKAVTNYKFSVEENDEGLVCRFVVDV